MAKASKEKKHAKKLPSAFDFLPPRKTFLDPDRDGVADPDSARAIVIPFGLEASVSYGSGTGAGPAAILAASHQLELFDEEFWRETYLDYGIAALKPVKIKSGVSAALLQLEKIVGAVLDAGKFPFVLGGEHSLTAGAIRPFAERYDDLVVLQLDAHADLRDGYHGEHYSHAAAMRRVLDHPNISMVQVGIRGMCQAEADFYDANRHRITMHKGIDQERWDIDAIVAPLKGKHIYITVDIDGLDSAVMPATGTPVPGGMSYLTALKILRRASEVGTVVGADLVEFAPIKGLHAYDYMAAALAYKMLNYALAKR
jgi:agmatinase